MIHVRGRGGGHYLRSSQVNSPCEMCVRRQGKKWQSSREAIPTVQWRDHKIGE